MKLNKFFSVIVASVLLTACSNSSEEYSAEQKEEIKVTAEINGMLTRAEQNAANLQDAAFATGSSFCLYLTSGGSAIANTPAAGYFTVTKNSSNYIFDTPAYFPSYSTSVDAFAIYPSTVTKAQSTFSVQENQSTDEAYKESDLMYAYKGGNLASAGAIPLQFNHCLCKIVVQVVNSDNTPSNELDGYDVTLDWAYTQMELSFDGNKISKVENSDTNDKIISFGEYSGDTGVSAIVVPQTFLPATNMFYFKYNSTVLSYSVDQPLDLEAGNVYTFKLKVQKASLSGSYSVKPWTNIDKEGELSRE